MLIEHKSVRKEIEFPKKQFSLICIINRLTLGSFASSNLASAKRWYLITSDVVCVQEFLEVFLVFIGLFDKEHSPVDGEDPADNQ